MNFNVFFLIISDVKMHKTLGGDVGQYKTLENRPTYRRNCFDYDINQHGRIRQGQMKLFACKSPKPIGNYVILSLKNSNTSTPLSINKLFVFNETYYTDSSPLLNLKSHYSNIILINSTVTDKYHPEYGYTKLYDENLGSIIHNFSHSSCLILRPKSLEFLTIKLKLKYFIEKVRIQPVYGSGYGINKIFI